MESIEMYDVRIMNERLKLRLDEASNEGDVNKLKQLMEEDPSVLDRFDHDVPQREGRDNPLHIAASHGHADFTVEVLGLKPRLAEMPNKEGRLPLHLAAARGHVQVVEKLIDQQVGLQFHLCQEKKYGFMPVHIAAINGKHTIVKMLIERCNDVLDKTTYRNETLLHLAVQANCLDSVRYLINQGVNLNEKDVDGNTCLHIACQMKNHQVITYLLDQESIEVNSINARGFTPLDVLVLLAWDSTAIASLVDMLRRAGGQGAMERRNPESNFSNSTCNFSHNYKVGKPNDAKTLLLVATLVATMTFPAILNPPGGFIPLPIEKNDARNATFYVNLVTDPFPAGRPVLLWQLKAFYVLDSMALFSSIAVILILLCGIPKTKFVMKFLVVVLWIAAFCTALAFASAFLVMYDPFVLYRVAQEFILSYGSEDIWLSTLTQIIWVNILPAAWSVVFIIAGIWASFQVIRFLWRKGAFKRRKLPNWVDKISWPKNQRLRKTTSIILMVCFLAVLWLPYGLFLYSIFIQAISATLPF